MKGREVYIGFSVLADGLGISEARESRSVVTGKERRGGERGHPLRERQRRV